MAVTCGCRRLSFLTSLLPATQTSKFHTTSHVDRLFWTGDFYKKPKEQWSPELFTKSMDFLKAQPGLMWEECKSKFKNPFFDIHPSKSIIVFGTSY